jgi:hypothetical protein
MKICVVLNAQFFDTPKVDGAGSSVGAVNGIAFIKE